MERYLDPIDNRTLMEGRYDEGLADGLVQGKAEGIAEGRLEERCQNVERMRGKGFNNEQISSILGLPLCWVENV